MVTAFSAQVIKIDGSEPPSSKTRLLDFPMYLDDIFVVFFFFLVFMVVMHLKDQEQKPSSDGEFSIVIILPLQLNLNFSSFQGTSVVTQDQGKGTLLITLNLFAVVVQRPFEETKMASVVRVCVERRFM